MKRSTLSAAWWLLLVFVSGVLVGVFGQRLYSTKSVSAEQQRRRPSPEEFRKRYMADLQKHLNLTGEQVAQVNQILDETKIRFDAIRERVRAESKPIQEDQQNRIRALLDDTQKAEYIKMLAEREERERKMQSAGGRR